MNSTLLNHLVLKTFHLTDVIVLYQVVKLDMDLRDDNNDDPLDRFARVVDLLHRISPLQALIYCRLTMEHLYQRRKQNITIVVIVTLVVFYMFYIA